MPRGADPNLRQNSSRVWLNIVLNLIDRKGGVSLFGPVINVGKQ